MNDDVAEFYINFNRFEIPRFARWFWSCFVDPGTCSIGTHKLGSPKT